MLPSLVSKAVYDATYGLTETTAGNAVSELQSSMKHSSGELPRSIKTEVVADDNLNVEGRVWSDKAHALYREMGTGPIGEASVKNLPEGVNPVYTQEPWFFPVSSVEVNLNELYGTPIVKIGDTEFYYTHGQPARPFLYPSYLKAIENIDEIMKNNVQGALRKGLNDGL